MIAASNLSLTHPMNICTTMIFYCADTSSHLGRVDYASFSQQTLMELVIDGLTNREKICGSKDGPKDISEWGGLACNQNKEVTTIFWPNRALEGHLSLQWLPETVIGVTASRNRMNGSLEFENLPKRLKNILLSRNDFSGTIFLRNLPEKLVCLGVSVCKLSGTIDLTCLPVSLKSLYLYHNAFSGWTDFSKLPNKLIDLNISNTDLEGEIHLNEQKNGFQVRNSKVTIHIDKVQI